MLKYLESNFDAANTRYELELLNSFLTPASRWLDIACGTVFENVEIVRYPRPATGAGRRPALLASGKKR